MAPSTARSRSWRPCTSEQTPILTRASFSFHLKVGLFRCLAVWPLATLPRRPPKTLAFAAAHLNAIPCLHLGPCVPERERPVKDQVVRCRIRVRREVAQPLELHSLTDGNGGERRLDTASCEDGLGRRVQILEEVAAVAPGVGWAEQVVVQADLSRHRVIAGEPVECCFWPATVRRLAASAGRVIRALKLDDSACRVLHD